MAQWLSVPGFNPWYQKYHLWARHITIWNIPSITQTYFNHIHHCLERSMKHNPHSRWTKKITSGSLSIRSGCDAKHAEIQGTSR